MLRLPSAGAVLCLRLLHFTLRQSNSKMLQKGWPVLRCEWLLTLPQTDALPASSWCCALPQVAALPQRDTHEGPLLRFCLRLLLCIPLTVSACLRPLSEAGEKNTQEGLVAPPV